MISEPSDDDILDFQVTGGGNIQGSSTEKRVGDLKAEFDARVEPANPRVNKLAVELALQNPGDLPIDQIGSIYSYLKNGDGEKKGWGYVRDPRGIDILRYANESLEHGDKTKCVGGGDCDDFAILMAALVESIGGTTRIILARNSSIGGHAYTEVYLGSLSQQDSQVEGIIGWLKQMYGTDRIYTHIDTDTKDIWLNLDWGPDEKGNAHPGGPFFQGDKHIVLCIRDSYRRTPLNLPDSYSIVVPGLPIPDYATENATINTTDEFFVTENATINVTSNATISEPYLQYIWSVEGIEPESITMVLYQNGYELWGFAKYEAEYEMAWNAGVYGSGIDGWQGLQLVIDSNTTIREPPFPITLYGSFANDGFNGNFIKRADDQSWVEGSFWANWITQDVTSYTPDATPSQFVDVRQYADKIGPGGDLSGVPIENETENVTEYVVENIPLPPPPQEDFRPLPPFRLSADKMSPQIVGTTVTWTVGWVSENEPVSYRFLLNGQRVTDWTAQNQWSWMTTEADVGESDIEVQIRDRVHADPEKFDYSGHETFSIIAPFSEDSQHEVDLVKVSGSTTVLPPT